MHDNIAQLAKDAGLHSYTLNLPYNWTDAADEETNEWPQNFNLVWCYDLAPGKDSLSGYPVALDEEAQALMARMSEELRNGDY